MTSNLISRIMMAASGTPLTELAPPTHFSKNGRFPVLEHTKVMELLLAQDSVDPEIFRDGLLCYAISGNQNSFSWNQFCSLAKWMLTRGPKKPPRSMRKVKSNLCSLGVTRTKKSESF
jgi:hypothetical protein